MSFTQVTVILPLSVIRAQWNLDYPALNYQPFGGNLSNWVKMTVIQNILSEIDMKIAVLIRFLFCQFD